MDSGVAAEVDKAVQACTDELTSATHDAALHSSEEALTLWRLHVAGVLGAMVNHLLVPVWREYPEFASKGDERAGSPTSSSQSEAAGRAKVAVREVRGLLDGVSKLAEADTEIARGLREVRQRLSGLEEYLDGHHSDSEAT